MVAMAMAVAMEVDGIGPMIVVAMLVVVGEHQCLQKTDDDNGDDMTWQCDVTPYSERAVQLYSNIYHGEPGRMSIHRASGFPYAYHPSVYSASRTSVGISPSRTFCLLRQQHCSAPHIYCLALAHRPRDGKSEVVPATTVLQAAGSRRCQAVRRIVHWISKMAFHP